MSPEEQSERNNTHPGGPGCPAYADDETIWIISKEKMARENLREPVDKTELVVFIQTHADVVKSRERRGPSGGVDERSREMLGLSRGVGEREGDGVGCEEAEHK